MDGSVYAYKRVIRGRYRSHGSGCVVYGGVIRLAADTYPLAWKNRVTVSQSLEKVVTHAFRGIR